MDGKTIQEFGSITAVDNDDLLVGVDVSDTTDSAGGTNKQFTKSNLLKEHASLTGTETLTNKTLSTGSTIDTNVTVTAVLAKTYPVGSVYINATDSTNPATLLGFGTWSAFGAGRVMVGYDNGDTDFNEAEKTGGAKTHTLTAAEMPSHRHSVSITTGNQSSNHNHGVGGDDNFVRTTASGGSYLGSGTTFRVTSTSATGNQSSSHTHSVSGNTGYLGSGEAHNNMPPYITVYIWKRTA